MKKRIQKKAPQRKAPRRADGMDAGSGNTSKTHAQHRLDRQQIGVAKSLAIKAEQLFPALRGVSMPERLAQQARHVLENAKLLTERHAEGEISKEHVEHIINTVRRFADALNQGGATVLGLRKVKQSHYLAVMKLWEKQSPGEACKVGEMISHLRRLFNVIGRQDVIPRGNLNTKLLKRHGIKWASDLAFLAGNTYFDWASSDSCVEIIFQAITDPGKRVAAKMMHYWGMSLAEVVIWQVVDPDQCSFLRVQAINERRRDREVEISRDAAFAAKQMAALREAWNYCLQHDRLTICPSDVSSENYKSQLRQSIRYAFEGCPDKNLNRLSSMKLRDGFFCQVFRDWGGMSLEDARKTPQFAPEDRRRLAHGWNEAKLQLGVKGAKAAHEHKGTPSSWSQSISIERRLRSISTEFAYLRVGDAWVGDGDVSAGKCLCVRLLEGAQPNALMRLQELIEQAAVFVKLRIVRVLDAGDVPEGAAQVMVRSVPV